MDPAYAAVYAELYSRHWWWRARERFLLERLAAARSARESDEPLRILDVGCGDALFFDELSRFGAVEGIEPDATLLTDGPWRAHIHEGVLDAEWARDRTFDWVLMLDVLEHVEDPLPVLRAARTTLPPNGRLFLTVPAFPALWTSHDVLNHHFRRYTTHSLGRELRAAGLRVLEARYFFHWLAPLKLIVRLLELLRTPEPTPETVPPAPLNRLAYAISRGEQHLPGASHLPFGTSVYACCQPN